MVNAAGEVYCWGENDKGQLGNGTTTDSPLPVLVSGVTGARSVTAGEKHACAVLASGQVKCWGQNNKGQLGDGTTTDRATAVTVAGVSNAGAAAAGKEHSCALLLTGQVKCWGRNDKGQLGNGTETDSPSAVTATGVVGAYSIAAGEKHTCVTLTSGTASCWGHNNKGQLGHGDTQDSAVAVSVSGLSGAVEIAGGQEYSCAIVLPGSAKCWGHNDKGQLGDGTRNDSTTPRSVSGLPSSTKHVATGSKHTCSITGAGNGRCWGENDKGQLGNGTTADSNNPVLVGGLGDATDIAAGEKHTCALRGTGAVVCWGRNDKGQLGNGTTTDNPSPTPVNLSSPGTITLTFSPVADSEVRRLQPNTNFGTLATVQVDPGALTTTRGLFRFDVSQIPQGSTVAEASLRLCATQGNLPGAGHTHKLQRLASTWTELGVTWNNQPPVSAAVTATQVVPSSASCVFTDVFPDVQAWVGGANNYGWLLSDQQETLLTGATQYGSREYSSSPTRPQLTVTYKLPNELTYYLHENPWPPLNDTPSSAILPMAPGQPAATTLYNYDTDYDSGPGIVIARGGSNDLESDATRYQAWVSPALTTAYTIDGGISMTLWSATKDFTSGKAGAITIYLRDCSGAACSTIGSVSYSAPGWQSGSPDWHSFDLAITTGNHTVAANHWLQLKIIVPISSQDDLWFAYDTVNYDAHIHVPVVQP